MAHPTPPQPEPHIQADHAEDDPRHLRRVLLDLIDMGHDLAKLIHQKAMATQHQAEPNASAADFTIAFERIARSVRRTILLVEKLDQPTPTGYDIALAAQNRAAARNRPVREGGEDLSRLSDAELAERIGGRDRLDSLDRDDDFDDDLATRPIAEIIADIRADLAVASPQDIAPWQRGTPADDIGRTPFIVEPASDAPPRQEQPRPPYPLRR